MKDKPILEWYKEINEYGYGSEYANASSMGHGGHGRGYGIEQKAGDIGNAPYTPPLSVGTHETEVPEIQLKIEPKETQAEIEVKPQELPPEIKMKMKVMNTMRAASEVKFMIGLLSTTTTDQPTKENIIKQIQAKVEELSNSIGSL